MQSLDKNAQLTLNSVIECKTIPTLCVIDGDRHLKCINNHISPLDRDTPEAHHILDKKIGLHMHKQHCMVGQ